jgi:hypothetical protein
MIYPRIVQRKQKRENWKREEKGESASFILTKGTDSMVMRAMHSFKKFKKTCISVSTCWRGRDNNNKKKKNTRMRNSRAGRVCVSYPFPGTWSPSLGPA